MEIIFTKKITGGKGSMMIIIPKDVVDAYKIKSDVCYQIRMVKAEETS